MKIIFKGNVCHNKVDYSKGQVIEIGEDLYPFDADSLKYLHGKGLLDEHEEIEPEEEKIPEPVADPIVEPVADSEPVSEPVAEEEKQESKSKKKNK